MAWYGCRRSECVPGSLWLEHDQPRLFYSCQWSCLRGRPSVGKWSQVQYLIHRTFWAVYLTVWLILSGALPGYWYSGAENRVKWFIYLTNWAFLLLTSSALIRAATALYAYAAYERYGLRVLGMTWWLRVSWFAYSLSAATAIVVSGLYWGVIFAGRVDLVDVNTHGVNTGYLLLDLVVTAMPVRALHFWIPLSLGVCYIAFSVIFDFSGGTNALGYPNIYKVLDWSSQPMTAGIYSAAALAAIVVTHILLFGMSRLRSYVGHRCSAASSTAVELCTVSAATSSSEIPIR